jgi:hypothetical protein
MEGGLKVVRLLFLSTVESVRFTLIRARYMKTKKKMRPILHVMDAKDDTAATVLLFLNFGVSGALHTRQKVISYLLFWQISRGTCIPEMIASAEGFGGIRYPFANILTCRNATSPSSIRIWRPMDSPENPDRGY